MSYFPIILLAETANTAQASPSWGLTLLNYGVAGVMLGWFMYRDKRESDKQDLRHKENLEQSKAIENAFRTNTTSIIVAVAATKNIDAGYAELLEKVRQENETGKRT